MSAITKTSRQLKTNTTNSSNPLLFKVITSTGALFVLYKWFQSSTSTVTRTKHERKNKKRAALDQPKCEAVIFDMDGLMIDSEPFWHEAQMECFSKVGINLTKQDCEDTVGIRILDICNHRYTQKPWDIEKLGITREELADMIVNRVIELVKLKGEPLKGLENCLSFVKSKNVKLGVCSSSSMNLINAVCKERLNYIFNDCFDVYTSAEYLEYGKPHPCVYLECAKKLNVNPINCLAFEDSLMGTLSAKSARMKVISVPQDYPNHTNKFEIADKILKSLNQFDDNVWKQIWG